MPAIFLFFLGFIFIGCSSSNFQNKSLIEKAEIYEQRAKTSQKLSELQRLSPPYSSLMGNQGRYSLHGEHMRRAYLQEAKRYRKLAQQARDQYRKEYNASSPD